MLDERIHAYRRDLADIALAGQLFAPHYARPMIRKSVGTTKVWESPCRSSATVSELGAGDEFAVLEIRGDWAWGYCRGNHNVGYVPAAYLDTRGSNDPGGEQFARA